MLGTGSCRDYAVLMMEAARHWGFGARFVTGYIQMDEGQHGSTHAWTEIYISRRGLEGIRSDRITKFAGAEHVSVAVARDPDKASPLIGAWEGPFDAFDSHGSIRAGGSSVMPKHPRGNTLAARYQDAPAPIYTRRAAACRLPGPSSAARGIHPGFQSRQPF